MNNKSVKILLVDDTQSMRHIAKSMLEKLDYQVITAAIPEEAIHLFKKEKASIDLLLTDFVMPGLNGYELKNKIEKIKPGIKTLFISGHPIDIIDNCLSDGETIHFLQKPFTVGALAEKVIEALGYTDNSINKNPALNNQYKKFIQSDIY
jgi:two-component system, cell cycle sensor histidine kinase and response regulator CckA